MKNKIVRKIFLFVLTLILILNSVSLIAFSADESDYTAAYSLETSQTVVHPGEVIDVYVSLNTNYSVFAAQAAVLYDSNIFEIVIPEGSSATSAAFLTKTGDFSGYTMTGNAASSNALYSRNKNPEYWLSKKDVYKIAFASFSGDSYMGMAVQPNGKIFKFSLKVRENAEFGTSGDIFMHEDWIKTKDCNGGLVFVGRSVYGDFNASPDSYVSMGQTIDLSAAKTTVTVSHTETDWIVEKQPTETERGLKIKKCTICNEVTQQEVLPAFNDNNTVSGTVETFDDFIDNSDSVKIELFEDNSDVPAYTTTVEGTGKLQYSLESVFRGTYTVRVSKLNHVTREYTITVDKEIVTQDLKIHLLGDIDGNGEVKINDLSRINAHVKETRALEGYALACADVTGEGDVKMNDLSRVNAHVKEAGNLYKNS